MDADAAVAVRDRAAFRELARLSGLAIKESVLDALIELCMEGRSGLQIFTLLNNLLVKTTPLPRLLGRAGL